MQGIVLNAEVTKWTKQKVPTFTELYLWRHEINKLMHVSCQMVASIILKKKRQDKGIENDGGWAVLF